MTPMKDVKVLVVDDNALILDLLMKGLLPHCDARAAADGADALLPPALIPNSQARFYHCRVPK
jgi:hypothetical protein